jgi:hypothetical protein
MLTRTLAHIQEVVPVTKEFVATEFAASTRQMEGRFIVPILGKELYGNLNTALDNATEEAPLSETEAELIRLCRIVTNNIGMVSYLKVNQAKIGNGSAREATNENQRPARLAILAEQQDELLAAGFEGLEMLLQYLELPETVTAFPELDSNQYWKDVRQLFVWNAGLFSKWCSIDNNRWTFMQLVPWLQFVEKTSLIAQLGKTFMASFRAKVKAGTTLTDPEKELLEGIEIACSNLAMAKGLVRLSVNIGSTGVTVYRTYTNESVKAMDPAELVRLELLKTEIEADGALGIDAIRTVLYANADATEFADWRASTAYQPPSTTSFENDPEKPIFFAR